MTVESFLDAVRSVTVVAVPVVFVLGAVGLVVLGVRELHRRRSHRARGGLGDGPRGGEAPGRGGVTPAGAIGLVLVGVWIAAPVLDAYSTRPPTVVGWVLSAVGIALSLFGVVELSRAAVRALRRRSA